MLEQQQQQQKQKQKQKQHSNNHKTTTGIDGCAALLPPLYDRYTRIAAADGAAVLGCFRAESAELPAGRGAVGGWRGRTALELPASAIKSPKLAAKTAETAGVTVRRWVTFPGLFAGGGLDIMTRVLLEACAATVHDHIIIIIIILSSNSCNELRLN